MLFYLHFLLQINLQFKQKENCGLEVKLSAEQAKRIETLKENMNKTIFPLDVIAGILYYFGKDVEFSTNHERIQRAFYKHKEDPILGAFKFKKGGPYPYSELLENTFTRITISGLLSCYNPDYKIFKINEGQIDRINNNSLNKFKPELRERLKKISEEIHNDLSL